ncbi:hypothetical protein OSTOST_25372, partial [Ostertagia ostertagi]
IINHKPQLAWDIYARSTDPKGVFQHPPYHRDGLLFNDMLIQMGEFYYAAKAFDGLEKIDPLRKTGKENEVPPAVYSRCWSKEKQQSGEQMSEVLQLLDRGNHPQADFVSSTIRRWAKNHEITLE